MNHLSARGSALPSWWSSPLPSDAGVHSNDRVALLLYSEALSLLRRAQSAPDRGRREVRAVIAILEELSRTLLQQEDRDAVVDLVSLYRYMTHRLVSMSGPEVHVALAEVERLFATLVDGWVQVLQAGPDTGFPDWLEPDDSHATHTPFPVQTPPRGD